MKLFNLCFADDLLLFCKAEEQSVILFRDTLRVFAKLSGLHANVNKSQLILSKSAYNSCLRFLSSKREFYRIQLLKSVISALNVYWAMAFILPKGTLKTIEAHMRKFYGKEVVILASQRLPGRMFVGRWRKVVKCNNSSIWVTWIIKHYLRCCLIWTVRSNSGSWSWRKILKLRNHILSAVSYHVGSGERFLLWLDPWHPLGPLIHRFPRGPSVIGIPLAANLSEVIDEDGWNWPLFTNIGHLEIMELLPPLGESDTITWRSVGRELFTTDSYRLFQPTGPKVPRYVLLLGPFRIPRERWRRMSTYFFRVNFTSLSQDSLGESEVLGSSSGWQNTILWASRHWRGRHPWNALSRALFASVVYHIWMECNKRRFGNAFADPGHMAKLCLEQIRLTLLGADLRLNVSTSVLLRILQIPWHTS
ncbi:UNVERIFIED_CONTAM: hypothetical protein Slati_0889300 [Sesamum latifolium]|uniref:Reverse transcriptase domain-containing protein n=1 Tax=Sesamum latifolium TaxID=2727402 RepID=A0AAW2XT73_9LAMI